MMRRGFTLVELLVAVAVIAVLVTIGSLNFSRARAKSRDAKRVGDLSQIRISVESNYVERNLLVYPTSIPANLNNITPPRPSSDAYCFYRRGDGQGFILTASTMETDQAAAGDQTNGFEVQLGALGSDQYEEGIRIAGNSPCGSTGAVINCSPTPTDNIYCLIENGN